MEVYDPGWHLVLWMFLLHYNWNFHMVVAVIYTDAHTTQETWYLAVLSQLETVMDGQIGHCVFNLI